MGVSPKSETRCRNFSFFWPSRFKENETFEKRKIVAERVSDFGEMPIPDWRSPDHKALLKCVVSVV
jgi:hypothetical protein